MLFECLELYEYYHNARNDLDKTHKLYDIIYEHYDLQMEQLAIIFDCYYTKHVFHYLNDTRFYIPNKSKFKEYSSNYGYKHACSQYVKPEYFNRTIEQLIKIHHNRNKLRKLPFYDKIYNDELKKYNQLKDNYDDLIDIKDLKYIIENSHNITHDLSLLKRILNRFDYFNDSKYKTSLSDVPKTLKPILNKFNCFIIGD